ncbi:protein kinase domain-containing protein [Cryptosporidium andersoni]|uniref:mitogen-activated protein kinase kinase n=1 Tax=Cryptosporidium andersoni TaxID=117008 RepID=A0A1J4MSW0_9CRYT|nr:protein kinase domain-containing protein [Cryptosporidium andersoni]
MSGLRLELLENEDQNGSCSEESAGSLFHTDWSVSSDGTCLLHKSTGLQITHEGTIGMESRHGLGDIQISSKDFEILPTPLGHGRSSVVYNAIHKLSKQKVAIKDIYVGDEVHQTQLSEEINAWRLTSYCPLLVQFLGAYMKPFKKIVCLIMEYMEYGSLYDILYKNPKQSETEESYGIEEKYLKFIVIQIVDGLAYLHRNDRIHRDVKLNNILINKDGAVKISDFGISKFINENTTKHDGKNLSTFVGTQIYMSPERLQGKTYSFSSDIWSLGICIYEMAAGSHPFKSYSLFDMVYMLCNDSDSKKVGNLVDQISFNISLKSSYQNNEDFNSFLRNCLEIDPKNRATAQQLQCSDWLRQGTANRFEFLQWLKLRKPHLNI